MGVGLCVARGRHRLDDRGDWVVRRPFVTAVAAAGGLPLAIGPSAEPAGDWAARSLEAVDGLLLSGGPDIDPRHYGAAMIPEANEFFKPGGERDEFELAVCRLALDRGMPVFAVCRGIQVLNVALGGTLWQHLSLEVAGDIEHDEPRDTPDGAPPPTHPVRVAAGSLLGRCLGLEAEADIDVNSYHHQAPRVAASDLSVSGLSPDGVIEALEHPSRRFVLGVQWHPELMCGTDERARSLFRAFVAAAGGSRV